MSDLLFREQSHTYLLDGSQIPSVSDLCRFLRQEAYKDAPAWRMEAAAARGSAVHAATQALDSDGCAGAPDEYLPYVQAYAAFHREHMVCWELIEKPFYHPDLLYAGTIDRYGTVDGHASLVDIKTTYTLCKPLCAAQLNLYRLMLAANGIDVQRLYILHLKRDGTYKLVRFDFDDLLPNALITIHNALRKRKRKGNKNV